MKFSAAVNVAPWSSELCNKVTYEVSISGKLAEIKAGFDDVISKKKILRFNYLTPETKIKQI